MIKTRLTLLETLSADTPDILTVTRTNLDHGKSSADIAALLNTNHPGLPITKSTVEKFRTKRWLPERLKLSQDKAHTAETSKAISPRNLDQLASALLFQTIHTMTPSELIGLKRLRIQELRLKLAKGAMRKLGKEQQTTEATWNKLSAEERAERSRTMANEFREIFGLCPIEEEEALHEKYPDGIPTNIGARVSTTIRQPKKPKE